MRIEKIRENPFNFNVLTLEKYNALKNDVNNRIKNKQKWFTKMIVIRSLDNGLYELIDGHQKFSICKDLGISEIPNKYIDIQNLTEEEAKRDLWSNNIKGRSNPIKKALFLDEDRKKGLTNIQIGEKYAISKSRVSQILRRLKNLHPQIIEEERGKSATANFFLTEKIVDELMSLKNIPDTQLKLYREIKKKGMSLKTIKSLMEFLNQFGIKTFGYTKMKVGKKWIDLGVMMDEYMEKEFNDNLKYHSYKALGENPTKKSENKWILENYSRILEELKPIWIKYKRISKDGYAMYNWNMTDKEIEKELFPNLKIPIPSVLKGID